MSLCESSTYTYVHVKDHHHITSGLKNIFMNVSFTIVYVDSTQRQATFNNNVSLLTRYSLKVLSFSYEYHNKRCVFKYLNLFTSFHI